MLRLRGVVQHYDWGDTTFIPEFLGAPGDGRPWAELWFGTHEGGPSDALVDTTWTPLRDVVGDVGILVKILSASRPLSLQTHPSLEHARVGFARENAAGIPINAANRVYKDAGDKPEMLIALTEFDALCGFAPIPESCALLARMGWTNESSILERQGTRAYLEWAYAHDAPPAMDDAPAWLRAIAVDYPRDKSLRVAPLLNLVHLEPGEAIALPAGNLHAYLHGSALEVMSSSDNVVRAGFTSKHVDVGELLDVVDTSMLRDPLVSTSPTPIGRRYESPIDSFTVEVAEVRGQCDIAASDVDRILVCTDGNVGAIRRGEAALLRAGERLAMSGAGTVYVCAGR